MFRKYRTYLSAEFGVLVSSESIYDKYLYCCCNVISFACTSTPLHAVCREFEDSENLAFLAETKTSSKLRFVYSKRVSVFVCVLVGFYGTVACYPSLQ